MTHAIPEFSALRWEQKDRVVHLVLDRPPVNALNIATYREIETWFSSVEEIAPEARVILWSGSGPHFCVGRDLKEGGPPGMSVATRNRIVHRSASAVGECPLPIVAAVHGTAVGGGLGFAASADALVVAEGTRVGMTEIRLGLMGGAAHLSRLVPPAVVRWMCMTGALVPVEELERYGGFYRVVPEEKLLETAFSIASDFASQSGIALKYAKHTLNAIADMSYVQGFKYEQRMTYELSKHPDALEARTAFTEGREPVFET